MGGSSSHIEQKEELKDAVEIRTSSSNVGLINPKLNKPPAIPSREGRRSLYSDDESSEKSEDDVKMMMKKHDEVSKATMAQTIKDCELTLDKLKMELQFASIDKAIFPNGVPLYTLKDLQRQRQLKLDYENWSNLEKYYNCKITIEQFDKLLNEYKVGTKDDASALKANCGGQFKHLAAIIRSIKPVQKSKLKAMFGGGEYSYAWLLVLIVIIMLIVVVHSFTDTFVEFPRYISETFL